MNATLLRGERVRLAAANPEADAEAFAAWSRDWEFLHLLETGAARFWTAESIKAELKERQGAEKPNDRWYPFVIRTLDDDRLIGFCDLDIPHWSQRDAWLAIGIGRRQDWGRGYGADALRALVRYAFAELNLERVTLNVFAYNERAQRSYLKAGFQVEGRQRERLRRGSRRYDMIFMSILRDEWRAQLRTQLRAGSD